MTGQTIAFLKALLEQIGAAHLSSGNLIIIAIEIDYDLFGDRQALIRTFCFLEMHLIDLA